ncbi:PA1571 family protein [Pseudomonas sp. UBA6562]|uniref:PA1571 family protein n=1 Tax=Pseudomonas sp. UBA6562 TaxID=1947332 RepID=UPI0025E56A0E|nr:PA1571 family protein [Pseudomonas sp. UBA6562]
MSLQHTQPSPKTHTQGLQQPCGSILDAQGREVPITEDMIQQACQRLEESRADRAYRDRD